MKKTVVMLPRHIMGKGEYSFALARRKGIARLCLLRDGKRVKGHVGTGFIKVGKKTMAFRFNERGEVSC